MFEIHISFDIQSVLFGKYKNRNLFKFNNLLILIVKQVFFPVIQIPPLFEHTCSKKYYYRKAYK